ncbi:transglycosylase domain-containing protein [Paremcibacter congregatus]|uniref:Penicillin-binding protein n=1 Tax=Paremcibacter congregatus TaxID=2043170 RepID=A0A2G4YPA5_9PROT|nr:PBP1A family penicillin-binding protein [Paremcibacter congregatus]PHZ84159.1 penicillin-binding protein [Paremcibacter congregatus]QDE25781.1 PBP1A family penicillin-binding protein [Paremcibacter congregatus]
MVKRPLGHNMSPDKKSKPTKPASKAAVRGRRKAVTAAADARKQRTGWRKFFYRFFVTLVWGMILMIPVAVYYAHDLPDISDMKVASGRSTIMVMDRDNQLLASYGDVYGDWLEYDEIPQDLVHAVIATEDRRFFDHNGIDVWGIGRAVVRNVTSRRMAQGGSTITQQLAKNLFLSAEKTLKRKVQELLLSYWLEMNFSKQEILTYYFNRVYFGSGAYGIDAAARTFFGHEARRLNLVESAMIAGVLKGPALYSPLRDLERSYRRTEVVLDNMVEAGFIPQDAADRAKGRSVNVVSAQTGGDERYFTDWIVERAAELVGPVAEPIIIYTTLLPDVQSKAGKGLHQIMSQEGEKYNAGQAALVSLDMDGGIRAMVGGVDYGESQYNRATQARRQPGSAFKLFVYLAALEAGLGPDEIMRDSPVILDGWEPKNYTGEYRGRVSLKEAFAHSLNTVAVKLSERINRKAVMYMAQRLGVTSPIVEEPSMSLGTSEMSLLELTAAYTVVANGGYRVAPYGIVEIQNSAGQILFRHMPGPPEKLLSDEVVMVMNDLLQAVVENGTARQAQMPFPVAGKTGTTQDYKDALFMGYGLNMVNGVWVGNDDASPMKRVTGGGTPARIWRNFMYRVHMGRDDAALTTPNVKPREKPDHTSPQ